MGVGGGDFGNVVSFGCRRMGGWRNICVILVWDRTGLVFGRLRLLAGLSCPRSCSRGLPITGTSIF